MKVTMQLTLDGLVRALRREAHRLAEEIEEGRRKPDSRPDMPAARTQTNRLRVEDRDGLART